MNSQNNKNLTFNIPKEFQGLIRKHYNDYVIDGKLTNLDVLLICMHILEYSTGEAGSDYEDCKNLFMQFGKKDENFRKNIYKAKENNLLRVIENKEKTLKFLDKGLQKLNDIAGLKGKMPVYVIKSGANFSSMKLFEDFLNDQVVNDEILLCDTYISHETLLPFETIIKSIKSFRILTSKIENKTKFDSYFDKMKKEFKIPISFKKNKKLHDRYIIFDRSCWTIGASIKDLGNKDTIIQEIPGVCGDLRQLFEERWNEVL